MNRHLLVSGLLALATQAATAQSPTPAGVTAFVDVSVIPMDRERILEHQTVVVRDGRIASIEPAARATVPNGATRIDGRGKFLMPGLAEMHAHVLGPQQPEQANRDVLFLYLANGITTIRAMLGAPNQLVLRDKTARGEILGPTIFVGAPSLNGNSAPDPATAMRLVREHKAAGYDFLKLHPGIKRVVYDSIVAESRRTDITYAGHISEEVGLEHTLASKQSTIDHLDGYLEAATSDAVRRKMAAQQPVSLGEVVAGIDDASIARWALATKAAGVWNVPTAFLWESFNSPETPEQMLQRNEMKYAMPQWRTGWATQKRNMMAQQTQQGVTDAERALLVKTRRRILKGLADAGAPLLMGTDSPQMFNVPGFALHHEIEVMQDAGIKPFDVLSSGTRNVAAYAANDLKLDGRFGTVAVGNRADLVLLDANPLLDVRNVAKRSGVMVRGRWVPAAEIEQGLAELARKFAS
jgi:imidazolonepropionase-like amidohydrolase